MNGNGMDDLDALFRGARADGLTDATMDLVVANLNGPAMVGAVGLPLAQLATNEVTLAMNIMDMSGSMAPMAGELIAAYNDSYLEAMRGSGSVDDILISTVLFDSQVSLLHGYLPLRDAPALTTTTYRPNGTTALYDAVAGGMTNMVLYAQQLRQSGVMVRCILVVYSDGEDNASRQTAASVRRASGELLKHEIYTLAYVGFRPGGADKTLLRRLADAIGFPEALAANLSPGELRRIFHMTSLSTVRVSRGATNPAGIFT